MHKKIVNTTQTTHIERQDMGNKPSIQTPMKMPLKDRLLLSLAGLHSLARRRDGTVNRRLLSLLDPDVAANPKPVLGVCTSDFTIDSSRNLTVRVFVPSDPSNIEAKLIPVMVYFHGGGFSMYAPSSEPYDMLCRRISHETSAVVVSVNYRLAPEHKYPAAYDDCTDVLRFLDSEGTRSIDALSNLELDFGNCFLAGDSAGGNIVHHVARRWASSTQNWKKITLAGAILLQPFFGGEERTESEIRLNKAPIISPDKCDWAWKTFLPEDANRNHEASHVFDSIKVGIEEAFPPALVVVGGFDPLHDWQIRYYEALKEKGKQARLVEYPDAFHAFYVFPKFSDTAKLMEEINGFVQANNQSKV